MPATRKKHLARATIIYWFLLLYIISALVWWFISLYNQTNETAALKLNNLEYQRSSISDKEFQKKLDKILNEQKKEHTKYISEGVTFLLLTFLGAFFVYRSVRKQIRLQQQEKNFMMAITHELKTPIAISKLNLETLQKHKLDDSKRDKLIAMTLQETERLNSLTNNILVSAQLEGPGYAMSEEELDLSDLTFSCLDEFRSRFTDWKWEMEILPDIDVLGDPLLLKILINNLIENAVKYSGKNSTIFVSLKDQGKKAILSVSDNGIGIPDSEKQRIFDKFYRIGNEETRKSTGTGLGLYLCKKIAADHNADIEVTNNLGSGTTFSVKFQKIN